MLFSSNHNSGKRSKTELRVERTCIRARRNYVWSRDIFSVSHTLFFSLSLSLGSLWFLLLSLRRRRQAAKTVKQLFIFFTVLKTAKKSKKTV
jgi:hypothetical protein